MQLEPLGPRHADELAAVAGAIRVAIKTDLRNVRSQRAIDRLGATREGIWRNHRVLSIGQYRYSVIDSEWPTVAGSLRARSNRTAELASN